MKNKLTKTDLANLCIIFGYIEEEIVDLLVQCKENNDSQYYESLGKILNTISSISKEFDKYFEGATDDEK